jgi:hypothetical protein
VTLHTAIWTGSEMIVWGGSGPAATQAGAAYEPATATWSPLPIDASTPDPRYEHAAVWTGTEMVIWGGKDEAWNYPAAGGAYDPAAGTWRQIAAEGDMPVPRALASASWTGTEAIFWGGLIGNNDAQGSGGRYDPATDSWSPVSTGAHAPSARYDHTAVWTGDSMIVWGGCCGQPGATGARYDVANDSWSAISTSGAPAGRYRHHAVWSGERMIVAGGWSGFNSSMGAITGGLYDPATDTWSAMSQPSMYSGVRDVARGSAVWTGREMLLWGGEYMWCAGWSCPWYRHESGGRYDPVTDTWTMLPLDGFSPSARRHHTAVWTGDAMLVWGGVSSAGYVDSGGIWSAAAPASPGDSLRVGKSATADLSWQDSPGATAYVVKGCVAQAGSCVPEAVVASPEAPQFSDALGGSSMFYEVEAVNECGSAQ